MPPFFDTIVVSPKREPSRSSAQERVSRKVTRSHSMEPLLLSAHLLWIEARVRRRRRRCARRARRPHPNTCGPSTFSRPLEEHATPKMRDFFLSDASACYTTVGRRRRGFEVRLTSERRLLNCDRLRQLDAVTSYRNATRLLGHSMPRRKPWRNRLVPVSWCRPPPGLEQRLDIGSVAAPMGYG